MAQLQNEAADRFPRGLRTLGAIDGDAGKRVIDSLADIAPDFARYLIEFPFGDIYSRPGLDLRSREIATIAALTVRIAGWLTEVRSSSSCGPSKHKLRMSMPKTELARSNTSRTTAYSA